MITTVIFDLDGTLVQTEKLKALSYAKAAVDLCPNSLTEDDITEAFKDVVGLSRREVATTLVERFDLGEKAKGLMDEYGVDKPWRAYVQRRLEHYHKMIEDPETLRSNRWPYTLELLETVKAHGCKVALATMSHCEQTNKVLGVLELREMFDIVATRDDVENSKPDPEIYNLVMDELDSGPQETMVIEDSPAGVEAALNAGTDVIAVATPFTQKRLHSLDRLPKSRLVDDPENLLEVVAGVFEEHAGTQSLFKEDS